MTGEPNGIPGAAFVTTASSSRDVFFPEDFTDEQRMIGEMTANFVEEEVLPRLDEIESKDWDVTTSLLRRCGELGLLGIEVPNRYGGEELDKVSAMIVSEKLARVSSFFVSHGGQSGIGMLPIVYFGTEAQKQHYLPRFCTGEWITSYALSEASSGSDALSARATATWSESDRRWTLHGEKMWITNAGFADVFITFAQANGTDFSCFIVEKGYPGVSTGAEEHKMGLKGSSTRALILDGVPVPETNLVGEIGKGHKVAFNILNIGRAKLGAGAIGGGAAALNDAIQYARQRVAFGRPIASFGAIQQKIADMAIRLWVTEGLVYRTAGAIDRKLAAGGGSSPEGAMRSIEEYALECSALKVFGTEALDYCVDESVQIYGGYGYSAEYPVERYYRDARVNRIFEGTNEINRILIPTLLLKRAGTSTALSNAASAAVERVTVGTPDGSIVSRCRDICLMAIAEASRLGDAIRQEQQLLIHLADMIIDLFAMDTAAARAERSTSGGSGQAAARVFLGDASARIEQAALRVLAAVTDGQRLRERASAIRRYCEPELDNVVRLRQQIAEGVIEQGRFGLH